MHKPRDFDLASAHKYFSAECFNRAWALIDQTRRTPDEDEEMLRLSLVSTWHWTQRSDCTSTNLAVGYWQTARIYALLGQADNARRYGQLSLRSCQGQDVEPFYLGFAFEALARAEKIAGNLPLMAEYLHKAREGAARVSDKEEKEMLLKDLETLA